MEPVDLLYEELRDCIYRCGLTGFETLGVLSRLTAEVNAATLVGDGLLAPGPCFTSPPAG
jgi:hypothetical protein